MVDEGSKVDVPEDSSSLTQINEPGISFSLATFKAKSLSASNYLNVPIIVISETVEVSLHGLLIPDRLLNALPLSLTNYFLNKKGMGFWFLFLSQLAFQFTLRPSSGAIWPYIPPGLVEYLFLYQHSHVEKSRGSPGSVPPCNSGYRAG